MIKGGNFTTEGIAVATATAIPLAVAGLFLTMIVRTISVGLVHTADAAAKEEILQLLNVLTLSHFFFKVFVLLSLQPSLSLSQLLPFKMLLN